LVGKKILEDSIKEAIKIYIGKVFEGEPVNVIEARSSYWQNEDIKQALDLFPSYLRIERKMLLSLKSWEHDYFRALSSLPFQFQKLFVHAFQSYLFNQYLKKRNILHHKNIMKPISGEIEKNNVVYVPIIGANTKLEGEMGEIYQAILEEEELSLDSFQKPLSKKLGGKGTTRSISFMPREIKIKEISDDELNKGKIKVNLSFQIQKGSYATEFLKEITG